MKNGKRPLETMDGDLPESTGGRLYPTFLTLIPVSAMLPAMITMLFAMTSLRQTGSGMISARADRGQPKGDFFSIG
ncbi:MAG: hypothetical protein FJ222_10055 [Lentisphaerae bacterium]|nr:hypothetical protein [Lentisphaerota bacterium]